jgi:predicted metal-dependent peptidase
MKAKLAAARVRVMERMPYLGACLWKMRVVEVQDAQWVEFRGAEIGVTARGLVLVKEALVNRCSTDELAAGLAHEVMHVLLDHAGRKGGRDPLGWNVAGDAAINDDLLTTWGNLPYPRENIVTAAFLDADPGLTADAYYDMLEKKIRADTCCGSGAGHKHPTEDAVPDTGEAPDAIEWEATRIAVAGAIRDHVSSGKGSAPGGLKRWAEASLAPSPVNWRRAFAGAAKALLRRAGAWDFDRSRPSRRSSACPDLALPSMRAPVLRACVIVDTSASRSQADLAANLSDVKGILRSSGALVEEIDLIACDAEVQARGRVQNISRAGHLLAGGGGTDMRPGFEEARKSRPDVTVCLTDGEVGNGWPVSFPVRTVIVVPEGAPSTPSWARRIEKPRV